MFQIIIYIYIGIIFSVQNSNEENEEKLDYNIFICAIKKWIQTVSHFWTLVHKNLWIHVKICCKFLLILPKAKNLTFYITDSDLKFMRRREACTFDSEFLRKTSHIFGRFILFLRNMSILAYHPCISTDVGKQQLKHYL